MKHPGEKAELIGVNVAIWSSGTNLIKSNDIAPQDPLFIHTVSRSPIVFSTVAKQTDSARNIVLQVFPDDPANLGISFDYLNPRDGAVFSIFYEGQVDEEIKVKGSIMGGNAPEKRQGLDMISPRLTVSLFLLGLVIFFFGITISATSAIVGALSLTLGVIFYPISLILAVNIHRQRAMPSTLKDSFLETPCVLTLVMRKSYESSPFKEIDRIMKKYRDESEQ
ncbi:MAG: hypothetical protein P9X24_16160 [Candidatus Hatepunaea meridiana]|nr:hypothetical protein [Candidatus Hatepunaea meridiana]